MANKWNKERIVAAIRLQQKKAAALRSVYRDNPGLYMAAYRFFGSWGNAVLAAGGEPLQRRWSKQKIIKIIRARYRRGLPMHGIWREDMALYSATYRHFGGWHRALLAAGLPGKPKPWWNREAVIQAIRSRHRQRLPLVGMYKLSPGLCYAAAKFFGTWSKAVTAAGIPDGWQRGWSRQRVIAALKTAGPPGQSLSVRQAPPSMRRAAATYFGSWHDALRAVGRTSLRPRPNPRRRWSRNEVIRTIRFYAQRHSTMTGAVDPALAQAAYRHFGSWNRALWTAGIKPRHCRKWSPQRVVEEIQSWHRRSVKSGDVRIDDKNLLRAAMRYFGGWRHALKAADISLLPGECSRNRIWSRRRVIESIQNRYVQGSSMIANRNKRLAEGAVRVFGSWRAARIAAGVPVGEPPRSIQKWDAKRVIEAILARQSRGLKMTGIQRADPPLAAAAGRYFGGWRAALTAAGVIPGEKHP